jgi:thiol-disulfide isomerase/thioredoxin
MGRLLGVALVALGLALVAGCARDSQPPVPAQPAANSAPAADEAGGAMMAGNGMMAKGAGTDAPIEGDMPELTSAATWLNSPPLTRADLKGKVVVVDFWTYSCINCLRALPYVNAWYDHYKASGLVIIGVHSPEFGFEKDAANVQKAISQFHIQYPVAMDNDMAIWNAFKNRFWPAHYFIDAQGRIRGHHFGEGKYERSERTIRKLLEEAGVKNLPEPLDDAAGEGISAKSDLSAVESPETYIGYARAQNFASPGSFAQDAAKVYAVPKALTLNQWAFAGKWLVGGERAELEAAPGRIVFRFKARDLHLVLGPAAQGKPVRFRVTLDGKAPGVDHGMDIDAQGAGTVKEQRLYQLIRVKGPIAEHEFSIEFLDPQVEAYSFTFG